MWANTFDVTEVSDDNLDCYTLYRMLYGILLLYSTKALFCFVLTTPDRQFNFVVFLCNRVVA